jgi:hypothetical protein
MKVRVNRKLLEECERGFEHLAETIE